VGAQTLAFNAKPEPAGKDFSAGFMIIFSTFHFCPFEAILFFIFFCPYRRGNIISIIIKDIFNFHVSMANLP